MAILIELLLLLRTASKPDAKREAQAEVERLGFDVWDSSKRIADERAPTISNLPCRHGTGAPVRVVLYRQADVWIEKQGARDRVFYLAKNTFALWPLAVALVGGLILAIALCVLIVKLSKTTLPAPTSTSIFVVANLYPSVSLND
jgi:hypothetical protein